MNWHTETRAVSSLKDHPQNPREFTERGMADLRASIKSLGYVEPIAVNTDGTILSGHARCKVLLEAGLTEVEVRVPERALTDAEQREVLVRLNKNTAGKWDMDILSDVFEIQDLKKWGFDDKDLGISPIKERKEPNTAGRLVLDYSEDEAVKVKAGLLRVAQTPEAAVWQLLGLS